MVDPITEIEVGGVKYNVAAIENLVNSEKNFQADYTKKTQALADERKLLAPMTEFSDYLEANPGVADKVNELLALQKQGVDISGIDLSGKPKDDKGDKGKDTDQFAELNAKFDKLQGDLLAKTQQDTHDARVQDDLKFLDTELKRLKITYPFMRDKEVLAMVSVDPEIDIEDAAKFSHAEESKMRDKLVKDYLEKKESSNVTIMGKGPGMTLKVNKPAETLAEAREQAKILIDQANAES